METVNYKSPAGEWKGYNEDCKLQNYTDPYHTPNVRKSVLELTNGVINFWYLYNSIKKNVSIETP